MGRIKILHVGLDVNLGGIETYLLKISRNIDKSRFSFDFLAFDNVKPCFYDELSALGCHFKYITSRRKSWVRHIEDFKDLLHKERYDVVHCHFNSLTDISYVKEALKGGCKVIVHSRNAGNALGSSSKILGMLNKRRLPSKRITCAAVSDKAGEWMFGEGSDFLVLNNGLDTEQYRFSTIKRNRIREEFGIDSKTEIIVNVGALRTQKNHLFLIDVFDSYHRMHEDSILILVGEGELEQEILQKTEKLGLSGSIIFAGRRGDIPDILSASDKFLFPSLYEGFPNALIEAETSGLWCVASSTITEQACLDNCARVSLDSPIPEWVKALEASYDKERSSCVDMVEKAGFGIKQEMARLEGLYESLAGKCRVLELIGGSSTDGGAETLVKDYVLNIDRSRFETAVFVDWLFPGTANTRILTESKQLVYTAYPAYSVFWRGMNKFFRRPLMINAIKKTIKAFNPEVIHVHLAALDYLSELKTEIEGRKLLYTCHSTVEAKLIQHPEEDRGAMILARDCGMRFVALHSPMAKELDGRYGVNDSIVINNGIDISRFRTVKESKSEIRSMLSIPEKAFVVGHIGRFVPVKNHDFILKVFGSVKKVKSEACLLLIGDGEQQNEFIEKAKASGLYDSIKMLSNRTDIPQLLKAMDIFIFPSLYEGFPISLIEAQSAGLRCIVSDSVPHGAFITDLVVPMSLDDSVEHWRDAVLDQDLRGPFEDHLEDFDIKAAVRDLEKLYLGEL